MYMICIYCIYVYNMYILYIYIYIWYSPLKDSEPTTTEFRSDALTD